MRPQFSCLSNQDALETVQDLYIRLGIQTKVQTKILKTKIVLSFFDLSKIIYRTRDIITRGLYTFYPLFEVPLCTLTFGLMYG